MSIPGCEGLPVPRQLLGLRDAGHGFLSRSLRLIHLESRVRRVMAEDSRLSVTPLGLICLQKNSPEGPGGSRCHAHRDVPLGGQVARGES